MHKTTLAAHIGKSLLMLGCLLGTTLTCVSAFADDTDVFFSSAHGGTLSNSNILFVLDNSGSMGYDYNDVWRWGTDYSTPDPDPNDTPNGVLPNRLSDLQKTMTAILGSIHNVNIGMMTFTYKCSPSESQCDSRENYAELIHKVVNIDEIVGGKKNSETLQESVEAMLPRTNTPITAALYEAAKVMTAGTSGPPATADRPKVILSECQQNHIVILTDGIANSDVPNIGINSLIGGSSCLAGANGEDCAWELADWLNTTDHHPDSLKINPIAVHTIGFAFDEEDEDNLFLRDLAEEFGGGKYKQARDGDELVGVFNEILREVKDVDTTFVAPVTSTDQLNRLGNSNDLYFGMFTPSLKPQWDGNLKKYKLALDNNGHVMVADADGDNAISDATGYFSDGARSVWSAPPADGADVTKGGAASKISHAGRSVYTYVGPALRPSLNGVG
jgi:hypothetical protein